MQSDPASTSVPNSWVAHYAPLIPFTGPVLDLACGTGRHARLLADQGHAVVAVDRDLEPSKDLQKRPNIERLEADLENHSWPLQGRQFAGIVVVNYLYRPHLEKLIDNLQADGILIYSTFAAGNEQFGRPKNPDYLLQTDELLEVFGSRLNVLAHANLTLQVPKPAVRQQICASGPDFCLPTESD